MSFKPHQMKKSDEIVKVLRKHGVAYLAGEPRTGKTRTALRAAQQLGARDVLVLTKKNAIPGWHKEIGATGIAATVTNYEQAPKLSPHDYDMVVIDEAHNFAKVGKPSLRFKNASVLTADKPVLLLSGTPAVEKRAGLYYQFALSSWSPFRKFTTFYNFFRTYGVPHKIRINGREIEQYDRVKPKLLEDVEPYMVWMTQADAGITYQVQDEVHVVHLEETTQEFIRTLMVDNVIPFMGGEYAFESDMAVRSAIHQAESGAMLLGDSIVMLPNSEVVDYIRKTFGNSADVAVMAHYRSTREKLSRALPHVTLLSSDAHAEGVDLSRYKHFVVANSAFSGAKFIQRRERGVNMNRETQPVIHHIVTDGGISRDVYDAVSNKKDYNLQMFRRERAKHHHEAERVQ